MDDALRLEIERCARAEESRDRLRARLLELASEVQRQTLRPGGRLMAALIGSAWTYRVARRLRDLVGGRKEPERIAGAPPLEDGVTARGAPDRELIPGEWEARVARRRRVEAELRETWLSVGALLWRARVSRAFAPGRWRAKLDSRLSSLRASLTQLRAAARASASPLAPEASQSAGGRAGELTAVVQGGPLSGRLAAWRLARRIDRGAVAFVARGEPPPELDTGGLVLFLRAGVRLETPGWLEHLRRMLLADPELAAVAPTTIAGDGETADGAWEAAWEGGAPRLRPILAEGARARVLAAPADGAAPRDAFALGGSCVLYRGEALAAAPLRSALDGGRWSLDCCLALRERGWRFALAPILARGASAVPEIDPEGDARSLIPRWGPLLRRRILSDLVSGGGDWADRSARVALDEAARGELGGWVSELGWRTVLREAEADFVLRLEGDGVDRGLIVAWPSDAQHAPCQARCAAPANAEQLQEALLRMIAAPSFCLEVGAPDAATARAGGDLLLAEAMARALGRRGHPTVVQDGSATTSAAGSSLDVRLHLRGRRRRQLNRGQLNLIWHMSHPEEVGHDELNAYDLALVASRPYARRLASELDTPVVPFLQFTDPQRFHPSPDPTAANRLLFVGNWRGRFRRSVWSALRTGHPVVLYGQGWRRLAPEHAREDHLPNDQLPRLYSSAEVVLCDHWPEMRELGFIANRVFDVLACEALLLSDRFDALVEELGEGLATYRTGEELDREIELNLGDPARRRSIAGKGKQIVLEKHTVDHRADQLLDLVRARIEASPDRIALSSAPGR